MAKIVKVFQPGLIYVFSFKKYKLFQRRRKSKVRGWEKELNGRLVAGKANHPTGEVGECRVLIHWCKCIGRKVKQ